MGVPLPAPSTDRSDGPSTNSDAAAPAERGRPWRAIAFGAVLLGYALFTLTILFHTPVLTFDLWLRQLHLQHLHHQYRTFIYTYVMFGQRGPATAVFLPYFCWVAWRTRTTKPLVMLVTALILLNFSVAAVKFGTGRLGPFGSKDVHAIFAGGDIYPSGHLSNVVVLYGLMAMIALKHRKIFWAITVFLCITVGFGTIYLRTHWFSDVVGGWFAGALVLIALPWCTPYTQRWADRGVTALAARWRRRRAAKSAVAYQKVKGADRTEPPADHPESVTSTARHRGEDARPRPELRSARRDPRRPADAKGARVRETTRR